MATKRPASPETTATSSRSDESLLDAIHNAQETAVDLARELVDGVGEAVPGLWERPIVTGAPALQDLTDAAFSLTRGILDAQYDFAKRIVGTLAVELKRLQ